MLKDQPLFSENFSIYSNKDISWHLPEIKPEVTDSFEGLRFQRTSDCLCMMKLEHCWKIKKRLGLTSVVSRKKKNRY